jgi:hypothetical protein
MTHVTLDKSYTHLKLIYNKKIIKGITET